jgi:hypothetical protein
MRHGATWKKSRRGTRSLLTTARDGAFPSPNKLTFILEIHEHYKLGVGAACVLAQHFEESAKLGFLGALVYAHPS